MIPLNADLIQLQKNRTFFLATIAGLQLTSRQPCWETRTNGFPRLGTKLFYYANSAKTFFIVLTTNMAALSRGCKRSIPTTWVRVIKRDLFRVCISCGSID